MKKILVMVSAVAVIGALVAGCGKKEATPKSALDSLKNKAEKAVEQGNAAAADAKKAADAAAADAQKKLDENK